MEISALEESAAGGINLLGVDVSRGAAKTLLRSLRSVRQSGLSSSDVRYKLARDFEHT
jgi:hypothetical protein